MPTVRTVSMVSMLGQRTKQQATDKLSGLEALRATLTESKFEPSAAGKKADAFQFPRSLRQDAMTDINQNLLPRYPLIQLLCIYDVGRHGACASPSGRRPVSRQPTEILSCLNTDAPPRSEAFRDQFLVLLRIQHHVG